MQELEKILEEMKEIKDGNRKEKLYAKYPPNSKDQEVLNAYSQGYEDGTDNFYNATAGIIRKHMNDGWIPAKEKPAEDGFYVATMSGALVDQEEEPFVGLAEFEDGEWVDGDDVIAWRPLPEPYSPERIHTELNIGEIASVIKSIPAAFDKEKVIEKLKRLEKDAFDYYNRYNDEMAFGESAAFRSAIEIVEKGGVE